jgi:mRNA interferase RelE/StbE
VTGPRYELRFRPAALRQLRKLDSQTARRIKSATESLRTEPRPHGVKALTGPPWLAARPRWRLPHRVRVRDSELVVLVIQVGHRSQVYDRLPLVPIGARPA